MIEIIKSATVHWTRQYSCQAYHSLNYPITEQKISVTMAQVWTLNRVTEMKTISDWLIVKDVNDK